MKSGDAKRLAFLLGLVLLFVGFFVLFDPMAVEDRNCGSAIMRKEPAEQQYAERCDAKLDRRRWPGFITFGLGAVIVVRIKPGIMLAPD
jgi:hypothetical protein